ncbi:hypothetical protein [Pollutibacter soli]|uniref:nSTAND1 domain-containing NTPase n=1 Tax=Pollutibacter soli TaxID=3034157 RepID=UPI0030132F58
MSQQPMFETFQTCPYTGLRSFTEEESIYFKGRDEDIDLATAQLQRNKFLMLTGASGDGKSSLIYAGIIPNARAGFLKALYSRWCVADFRPERCPFLNLCEAVAKQLEIPAVETVQAELGHGFSALADLYKNSKRFADTESIAWQEADQSKRAAIKRDAANLMILVDQFEEFFTNPENYRQGAPSKDANLVLNLLLETARIALDEDLPIYIVFTMRSDYIGQCAAFRSLPEYLGFSQYFVPRLNRSQLQQVIEEPASLNANSITRRLTERLIHDITEGVDQLPILQHTLKQVWIAASNGAEEMDLIHYAMVGGLSAAELPDEQLNRFDTWFSSQSSVIRSCYHAPSLQNVLDTHCNKLYENAATYYEENTKNKITDTDAKAIIRLVFVCLTKIDQGRAVRNRMTLREITDIAANPACNSDTIAGVVDIFREPGSTFIHPFISQEHPENNRIQPNQILDITHESLIRNWQYLDKWAKEEYDSYTVSKDFEQQLSRWVNSEKSKDFLLSIGQLTYFENWFIKSKPNPHWIARYIDDSSAKTVKLEKAEKTLTDSKDFLSQGARKYYLTRKLMKIGPKRIAAVIAGIVVLSLCSFVINGMYKKQNDFVLQLIHKESLRLAPVNKVSLGSKAALIVEELKLGLTTIDEVIAAVKNPITQIHVTNGIAQMLILQGEKEPASLIAQSLFTTDSLLQKFPVPEKDGVSLALLLKEISDLRTGIEMAFYYNADPRIDSLRKRNGLRSAAVVKQILESQPESFENIDQLMLNLENAINQKALSSEEIKQLISILSPMDNGLQTPWLKQKFSNDKIAFRGPTGYGFPFNGLYQDLAYLYAAMGNNAQVAKCIDTLLFYNQIYYQNDYTANPENASNIAVVYYTYDQLDKLDAFVQDYCSKKKISGEMFYNRLIGRTAPSNATFASIDLFFWGNSIENVNLKFLRRAPLRFFFNKYREVVQTEIKDIDERNFLAAVSYKNEGILLSLNVEPLSEGEATAEQCFDQSIEFYRKVNDKFLHREASFIGTNSVEEVAGHMKDLFVYPDFRTAFHPLEPRAFYFFNYSTSFIEYLLKKNLFSELYTSVDDISNFARWMESYNAKQFAPSSLLTEQLSYSTLSELAKQIDKLPFAKETDLNMLYLYGGYQAFLHKDSARMLEIYAHLIPVNFFNILRAKEFAGNISNQSFRMIAFAVKALYEYGQPEKAQRLINVFKSPINRSSLYAYASYQMQISNNAGPLAAQLLDSAKAQLPRSEITTQDQPNREMIAAALALHPTTRNIDNAFSIIKNIPTRFYATSYICGALGFDDKLFEAKSNIPELCSDTDICDFYALILYNYNLRKKISGKEWDRYNSNYTPLSILDLRYIDENN